MDVGQLKKGVVKRQRRRHNDACCYDTDQILIKTVGCCIPTVCVLVPDGGCYKEKWCLLGPVSGSLWV